MTDHDQTAYDPDMTTREKFRHAFAIGDEHQEPLKEDEITLLRELAANIEKRGLSTMAIMVLQVHRPLNVLGANIVQMGQMLFETTPVTNFLRQFLGTSYSHELLIRTMEKRHSVDKLIDLIEEAVDSDSSDKPAGKTGENDEQH